MINGKGIKILCYILMFIIWIVSVAALLFGIVGLIKELGRIYLFLLVGGIVLPFVTMVSLYPIFALANIDQNLKLLNDKMGKALGSETPPANG